MINSWIGLIASCITFAGLVYAWHRIHVLERKLARYEEQELDNGQSVERSEK